MKDIYEVRNSIYCYKNTSVLINKLEIRDTKKLLEYESKITAAKLLALRKQKTTGNFDINHIVSIHKFLFEDIYPFAGKFRNENIAKDNFMFAQYEYIEDELKRILEELKKENFLKGYDKQKISNRLAYYMAELNVLHPFREGNGRTIREFIRQLALKNGYEFNVKNVNPKEMLDASIKSVYDTSFLEKVIGECLENIESV